MPLGENLVCGLSALTKFFEQVRRVLVVLSSVNVSSKPTTLVLAESV